MSSSSGIIGSSLVGGVGGYSAAVRLSLNIDDIELRPAQVGGGRVYFAEPTMARAGIAELVVEVDGTARRKRVRLHETAQPCKVVGYSPIE